MKTHQKLLIYLAPFLLGALLLRTVFGVAGSSEPNMTAVPAFSATSAVGAQPAGSTSTGETHSLNPSPPTETVKLVFIHHSVGNNWLDDGNGDLGAALGDNNYYVSDTYYDWGPDNIGSYTDIGHWWLWFRGPNRSAYLSALYATTDQRASYTRPMTDPGGENEIILFKSCYPNSNLKGNPDDPPTTGNNPLRGQSVSSPYHTVGNAKGIYNDILAYFQTRQDKLFVVIAAPPVQDETWAANARAFNNWLVNDWLDDYPYHNVVVFDFYNVLTTNGGNADTNDYGWITGNHHRVVAATMPMVIEHVTDGDDDASPDTLEYPTSGDNHPTPAGNQKATGEFAPLLNAYYNCWKYGDCWTGSPYWISLTAVNNVASIHPDETATYTLSLTASEGLTAPVTLTLQDAPAGTTTSFNPNPVTPPGNSQLYITTTITFTLTEIYTMTVTGSSGALTDTANLTLIVTTAIPSFTLSISPTTLVVWPNRLVSCTVVVTGVDSFNQPVTLASVGQPPGIGVAWSVNPVTPDDSSILTLSTPGNPPLGVHPFYVVGMAENQTVATSIELIIDYPFKSYLPIVLKQVQWQYRK